MQATVDMQCRQYFTITDRPTTGYLSLSSLQPMQLVNHTCSQSQECLCKVLAHKDHPREHLLHDSSCRMVFATLLYSSYVDFSITHFPMLLCGWQHRATITTRVVVLSMTVSKKVMTTERATSLAYFHLHERRVKRVITYFTLICCWGDGECWIRIHLWPHSSKGSITKHCHGYHLKLVLYACW